MYVNYRREDLVMKNVSSRLCGVLLLAGVLALGACKDQAASSVQAPAAVNAVKVLKTDLPWNIEYPAQVAGSLQVNVRAQVGGILESRLFNEGEYVTEGTQLFQIDDKEYKAALAKAKGALAQAQAQERSTRREYNRMKTLRADNAVSQKNYDDALSAYEAAQADVQVAQAEVSNAEINLGYTKVTAPISGITGQEAQSVGSLISPTGETGLLTTMVQIDPLWVNFSMPGRQFEKLASGYVSGQIVLGNEDSAKAIDPKVYREVAPDKAPIYVEVVMSNGKIYPEKGKIIFLDSSENAQTSSLSMKAQFANPSNSRLLMPGQFVRVRLVGATYKGAILVPSSAVLNTPNGMLVYMVDENNAIVARPVQGELQDNMYIITDGLKGGETIVSSGLIKVKPGMQVTVTLKDFSLPKELAPQEEEEPLSEDGRSNASLEAEIVPEEAASAEEKPAAASQAQTQADASSQASQAPKADK